MFHLKFSKFRDGVVKETNISCPRYDIYDRGEYATVSVYKSFVSDGGVDYEVCASGDERCYDVCYITNEAGKTVGRVGQQR